MASAVRTLHAVPSGPGRGVAGRLAGERWSPPALDRLVRALDLWRVGADDYLAMAVDPDWPVFPGAQLAAALVTAAERSAPGHRVALVSWSPGAPPSARRSVRISVDVVHRGAGGDVTARLTVDQRDSARGPRRPCGHAIAVLTQDPPALHSPYADADAASDYRETAGGARRRSATNAREAVPLTPGELAAHGVVPPGLLGGIVPPGLLSGVACPDPTTGRALLAYVGTAVTMPPGCSAYPAVGASRAGATVLASTVAFPSTGAGASPGAGSLAGPRVPGASGVPLGAWRLAGAAEAPADAHAHAMTEFRTPSGAVAAQISQAVLLAR